ncbi:MAG: 3'-5' exonuclease [Candidatus Wallbacteria bacterium]|nr:3'-5' exonuclease [Candidatus Wallbacteria bacterium]
MPAAPARVVKSNHRPAKRGALANEAGPEACFVAFDTETTGLDSLSRIVELAAIRYENGREVGRFATLIDPGCAIPRPAMAIHGITDRMVRGQPRAPQAIGRFLEFAGGATLIAHNASFDVRMINGELDRARLPRLTAPVMCTRTLARRYVPGLWDYRLETVAWKLGVTAEPQQHRAMADALLVAGIVLKLLISAPRSQ